MALRTIATAATILCVILPAAAHGQNAAKTACNDGTATTATGADACNGHGGVNRVHTTIVRRAPSGTQAHEPTRVTQAGTPASVSRDEHAQPEEHRGWRWSHRNDTPEQRRRAEENRRAEETHRAEEKRRAEEMRVAEERHEHDRHRVRCRDGRSEDVKVRHGKGKGPEICKHHGGVAH